MKIRGWTVAVAGSLVATVAAAQTSADGGASFAERVRSFLPESTDVAMTQVVSLFGPAVTAATGFEANAAPSVLGVTITYFLVGAFVVSLLMALYLTLAGTAQSAHSGQFLGERWHSLWVPLRAVLGWMLLLPLPALGGLAGIHALLFWTLAVGTGFANQVGLAGIESDHRPRLRRRRRHPDRRTAGRPAGARHLQQPDLRGDHQPGGVRPRRLSAAGRDHERRGAGKGPLGPDGRLLPGQPARGRIQRPHQRRRRPLRRAGRLDPCGDPAGVGV